MAGIKQIRKVAVIGLFFSVLILAFPIKTYSLRSFDDIFPFLDYSLMDFVFGSRGYKNSFEKNLSPNIVPAFDSGIDLYSIVLEKNPSHFVEALQVVPYNNKQLDKLDAYNVLGRIEDIKNHSYYSQGRNTDIYIFKESYRVQSNIKNNSIIDPPPARILPVSDVIYLRLKDMYFGNIYVQGIFNTRDHGVTCRLTNFRALRFLVFTVMKVGEFSAVVYLEPLTEGMLVYGMAAVNIPDFIAHRVNVSLEAERRLTILINWINYGLRNIS
jgi:hypothetical protein